MSVFSIAICDDEHESCSRLLNMVLSHKDSHNFLVKVFYSGEEMLKYISENGCIFDLVILDIRLKDLDGIEIGKMLRENGTANTPSILYISSYTNYAMELFKIRPINFLVKPLSIEAVLQNINIAIALSQATPKYFSYTFGKSIYRIPYSDILYFENKAKKVEIHCVHEIRSCYEKMKHLVTKTQDAEFISIHYSFLVNLDHVCEVHSDKVILNNKEELTVSRQYRKHLKEIYLKISRKGT